MADLINDQIEEGINPNNDEIVTDLGLNNAGASASRVPAPVEGVEQATTPQLGIPNVGSIPSPENVVPTAPTSPAYRPAPIISPDNTPVPIQDTLLQNIPELYNGPSLSQRNDRRRFMMPEVRQTNVTQQYINPQIDIDGESLREPNNFLSRFFRNIWDYSWGDVDESAPQTGLFSRNFGDFNVTIPGTDYAPVWLSRLLYGLNLPFATGTGIAADLGREGAARVEALGLTPLVEDLSTVFQGGVELLQRTNPALGYLRRSNRFITDRLAPDTEETQSQTIVDAVDDISRIGNIFNSLRSARIGDISRELVLNAFPYTRLMGLDSSERFQQQREEFYRLTEDGEYMPYLARALSGQDISFTNLRIDEQGRFNPFGILGTVEENEAIRDSIAQSMFERTGEVNVPALTFQYTLTQLPRVLLGLSLDTLLDPVTGAAADNIGTINRYFNRSTSNLVDVTPPSAGAIVRREPQFASPIPGEGSPIQSPSRPNRTRPTFELPPSPVSNVRAQSWQPIQLSQLPNNITVEVLETPTTALPIARPSQIPTTIDIRPIAPQLQHTDLIRTLPTQVDELRIITRSSSDITRTLNTFNNIFSPSLSRNSIDTILNAIPSRELQDYMRLVSREQGTIIPPANQLLPSSSTDIIVRNITDNIERPQSTFTQQQSVRLRNTINNQQTIDVPSSVIEDVPEIPVRQSEVTQPDNPEISAVQTDEPNIMDYLRSVAENVDENLRTELLRDIPNSNQSTFGVNFFQTERTIGTLQLEDGAIEVGFSVDGRVTTNPLEVTRPFQELKEMQRVFNRDVRPVLDRKYREGVRIYNEPSGNSTYEVLSKYRAYTQGGFYPAVVDLETDEVVRYLDPNQFRFRGSLSEKEASAVRFTSSIYDSGFVLASRYINADQIPLYRLTDLDNPVGVTNPVARELESLVQPSVAANPEAYDEIKHTLPSDIRPYEPDRNVLLSIDDYEDSFRNLEDNAQVVRELEAQLAELNDVELGYYDDLAEFAESQSEFIEKLSLEGIEDVDADLEAIVEVYNEFVDNPSQRNAGRYVEQVRYRLGNQLEDAMNSALEALDELDHSRETLKKLTTESNREFIESAIRESEARVDSMVESLGQGNRSACF